MIGVGFPDREYRVGSGVGIPIVVEGRLWGAISVYSAPGQPLPENTEVRLASFTELLATAIANAENRPGLTRLAEEQAALGRVATLVARGVSPEDVFAAVVTEVGQLLPVELATMGRYEADDTIVFVAAWGRSGEYVPVGTRRRLGGNNLGTIVFETGRPARADGYADRSSGPLGAGPREAGIRSSVAAPIVVEGCVWGVIAAGTVREQSLPADTEARLESFTELVATAIANAESHTALAASRADRGCS
jgi:GAF domain-containing protein